jgi:hypothetical protein
MNEPRRLLHQATSADVRRALLAGVDIAPPAKAERRVWRALSAALGAAGGALTVSATTAAGAKSGGAVAASGSVSVVTVAKLVAIGMGAGALALGTGRAWTSHATPPTIPAPAAAPASPPPFLQPTISIPTASQAPPERDPSGPALQNPDSPAIASPAPRPRVPSLTRERRPDESSIVLDARQALRSGHPADALALLRRTSDAFAGGNLEQERTALEIESLARLGARDEANRRARDFVETYPDSPYTARIRSLTR